MDNFHVYHVTDTDSLIFAQKIERTLQTGRRDGYTLKSLEYSAVLIQPTEVTRYTCLIVFVR